MSDEDENRFKDVLEFHNFIDYKNRCENNNLDKDHPFFNFDIKQHIDKYPDERDEELLKNFEEREKRSKEARL